VVVHICNPSTQRHEDLEFKANLGYIVRPCLKKQLQERKERRQEEMEEGRERGRK
jgi:hypothetical protein